MVQGVIFDFDGVILDTETMEYKIMNEIFAENGAHLPIHLWEQRIGGNKNNFDPYAYLLRSSETAFSKAELKAYKKKKVEEQLGMLQIMPGVEKLLEEASAKKIAIGLASSSPRKRVVELLSRYGLLRYFEYMATAEDVLHVKPYPDLYLHVLALMNLNPGDVFAIEDSPAGAKAAKSAGLFCVVVPNEVTKPLTFEPVNLKLNSLLELDLAKM
ncbi:HAD family hydrolase [Paenibacillus ginsengarvi]|uniref:HAD family phosphatase n=1 Tax=Paenibacillus ginsengarvi TaxID=400777 RepID=A0A3B0BRJ9_9BACL|nr:HAD family phosphatase [Paenibacillus ginsengarvi]RKN75893.1 HAD family phosphatase [Paenibacillus ginsengarvi]